MIEKTPIKKRSFLSAENALIILGFALLVCIIVIIVFPSYLLLFFIVICGLVAGVISIFRQERAMKNPDIAQDVPLDPVSRDISILQSMAEALQHPVFVLDEKALVKFSNKSAVETFGLIRNNEWLFLKFRQPVLRRFVEEGMHLRHSVSTKYNEAVPLDRWFSVELAPIPLLSDEGKNQAPLFLLAFHDLTEVKRTDKMRSDFIANVSHELRTPLASLLGYIETIKGPARQDEKAFDRFTDVMLQQAHRMTRLVNDLLSLSQIEMKSHLRPSDTVDLTEIITSVVLSLEAMAKKLGVEIVLEKKDGIFVIGDKDELLQVFENLIENACKYGQEGKHVFVQLGIEESDGEPCVVASVKDLGPGIALEDQQRITERFYRVDVEQSREKQGTGLGLAIVKHILNRHGTKLNIVSNPGEGAEFSIKLPVAPNE